MNCLKPFCCIYILCRGNFSHKASNAQAADTAPLLDITKTLLNIPNHKKHGVHVPNRITPRESYKKIIPVCKKI